jgi:hypothetical protein
MHHPELVIELGEPDEVWTVPSDAIIRAGIGASYFGGINVTHWTHDD